MTLFALFETLFLKRCQIFVTQVICNSEKGIRKSFLLAFIIKHCCLVLRLLSNKDMLSIKIDRFLQKSYFLLRLLKCLPASGYRRKRLIALVMAIFVLKFPKILSKLDKIFDQKSTYYSKAENYCIFSIDVLSCQKGQVSDFKDSTYVNCLLNNIMLGAHFMLFTLLTTSAFITLYFSQ